MSGIFLAPVFLLGALVAVVPVLIHLFFQRRSPQVFFSTVRFLQACVRKTARRKRIENILLLVLRMLLFGLLAVALARPFVRSSLSGGSGPASTVIILDNSYSMATRHQGVERFKRAKDMAEQLLREMSENDEVALVVTGGPAAGAPVELTHRLNDVSLEVSRARIFAGETSLAAGIARAYEALRESRNVRREIIVLTDLQASALAGGLGERQPRDADVALMVYDCGEESLMNLAVTDLELQRGDRIGSRLSVLTAKVTNPTDAVVPDARVTLYIETRDVRSQLVTVQPRASTQVVFRYPFDDARTVTGWVQLSDDSLDVDNRFNFRIGARERVKALVLRESAADIPYLDDAYYLERALAPRGLDDNTSTSAVVPHLDVAASLSRTNLSDYDIVCLVNLRSPGVAEVSALRPYVEAGGTVFLFAGANVDAARWNLVFDPDGTRLFPARLRDAVGDAERRADVWQMTLPDFDHGGMKRLKAIPQSLFERVRAYRIFPISDYKAPDVRVIAEVHSDSTAWSTLPLIASAPLGRGRVIFFAVPPTADWTNLPATKVFVPILQELIASATGSASRLESTVAGQPRTFAFGADDGAVTVKVEVNPGVFEPKTTDPASSDGNRVTFTGSIDAPGIYHYVTTSKAGDRDDHFVVNPYTSESELERMTDAELQEALAGTKLVVAHSADAFVDARRQLREGHPLSGYVFLVLLVVAASELFLANRTRPARTDA